MIPTVVILNPVARSGRAGDFRRKIAQWCEGNDSVILRETRASGDAASLTRWAVEEGFQQVVAAGGDGTINEVVNGIMGSGVRLGVLPMGTMNVFATELGLPRSPRACWEVLEGGESRLIDIPTANGHAFVQLAGVGLDAQVVRATGQESKRRLGPLSYLISAAKEVTRRPPQLMVTTAGGECHQASFVLMGNGRLYGGPFPFFPGASNGDGLLDVLIFKRTGYFHLARYLHAIFFRQRRPPGDLIALRADRLTITTLEGQTPWEVDGEVIGETPVTFSFHTERLRVAAPAKVTSR